MSGAAGAAVLDAVTTRPGAAAIADGAIAFRMDSARSSGFFASATCRSAGAGAACLRRPARSVSPRIRSSSQAGIFAAAARGALGRQSSQWHWPALALPTRPTRAILNSRFAISAPISQVAINHRSHPRGSLSAHALGLLNRDLAALDPIADFVTQWVRPSAARQPHEPARLALRGCHHGYQTVDSSIAGDGSRSSSARTRPGSCSITMTANASRRSRSI